MIFVSKLEGIGPQQPMLNIFYSPEDSQFYWRSTYGCCDWCKKVESGFGSRRTIKRVIVEFADMHSLVGSDVQATYSELSKWKVS